jgi:hypothetical protein
MKCAMIFAALALAAANGSELQFETSGVTASIAFNSASVLTVGDTSTCTKIDGDTACILDHISNIEAASCRQMGCATCSADLTQCTSCPQTEQTLTADGRCPVSGWIKLVDNAFYNGNSMPAPFVPLVHGDFTRIKAVRRSGCVGCSHSGSASGARWQCCSDASGHAADAISFELMKADTYIVQQPNWHTLPSQCNSDGVAGDIICDVSFSIDKFETITPTWQEPSNGVSLGDNHGTVYLDLYVWGAIREQSDQYVQILDNAAYTSEIGWLILSPPWRMARSPSLLLFTSLAALAAPTVALPATRAGSAAATLLAMLLMPSPLRS